MFKSDRFTELRKNSSIKVIKKYLIFLFNHVGEKSIKIINAQNLSYKSYMKKKIKYYINLI